MPKLDIRLKVVAQQIRSRVHVDIGSDHGYLLAALLKTGRIERGIAIENKVGPWQNSNHALKRLNCEVRLGDGLNALRPTEADSLSLCGMGGQSIVKILTAHPDRIPGHVVLQPNRGSDLVRRWGLENRYHLVAEPVARGQRPYQILVYRLANDCDDPAYQDLDQKLAVTFGPLILKRREPEFVRQLREERSYLNRFKRLSRVSDDRLQMIDDLLENDSYSDLHPPD